jgi:hypothetical protein
MTTISPTLVEKGGYIMETFMSDFIVVSIL